MAKDLGDRSATAEALVEAVDSSQLAGPEIPLPVRTFTQEVGTMSRIVFFVALISWYTVRALAHRMSALDAFLPVVILFAVGFTRVMQTLSDARRLTAAGFTRDVILEGMRDVLDEREQLRAALRADEATRRRRRTTLFIAIGQLAAAVGFIVVVSYRMRVRVGPEQYAVPTVGIILLVLALLMTDTSFVLVARSPMRMPPPPTAPRPQHGSRSYRDVSMARTRRQRLSCSSNGGWRRWRRDSVRHSSRGRAWTGGPAADPALASANQHGRGLDEVGIRVRCSCSAARRAAGAELSRNGHRRHDTASAAVPPGRAATGR